MRRFSLIALAYRIAGFAALMAPSSHRAEFRAEWSAETAWATDDVARRGRGDGRVVFQRSLGAFAYALWLRKEQRVDMLWQDIKYGARVTSSACSG